MANVYKIINLIDKSVYTGQNSTDDPEYFGSGIVLKNSVRKHGRENFIKGLIVEGDFNEVLLNELEKHFIRIYSPKEHPKSYNLTDGGEGCNGYKPTQEAKDYLSKLYKGKKLIGNHLDRVRKAVVAHRKPVDQFDRDGNYIKSFESVTAAAKELNVNYYNISMVIKSIKTCKNFYWKFSDGNRKIEIPKNRYWKPILQYDLQGNFIKEYKSSREACRSFGVSDNTIGKAIRESRICGGFIWKYKYDNK